MLIYSRYIVILDIFNVFDIMLICLSYISDKRLNEEVYDPAYKKTKSSYSVAKDPSASGVYKSLFTTHENAKNHSKAHWITCNPFYN